MCDEPIESAGGGRALRPPKSDSRYPRGYTLAHSSQEGCAVKRHRNSRVFGPLLVIVIPLLFACAPAAPQGQPQTAAERPADLAAAQEYRFSLTGEPPGLDPQYTSWDP